MRYLYVACLSLVLGSCKAPSSTQEFSENSKFGTITLSETGGFVGKSELRFDDNGQVFRDGDSLKVLTGASLRALQATAEKIRNLEPIAKGGQTMQHSLTLMGVDTLRLSWGMEDLEAEAHENVFRRLRLLVNE
jgi:hypothetical protein